MPAPALITDLLSLSADQATDRRGAILYRSSIPFCSSCRAPNENIRREETRQSSIVNHDTSHSGTRMNGSPRTIENCEGPYPGNPSSVRRYCSIGVIVIGPPSAPGMILPVASRSKPEPKVKVPPKLARYRNL